MSRRVLVGQFMFEANTFSAGVTTPEDFAVLSLDACVSRDELLQAPGELGAACRILAGAGYELVPSVLAVCGPGPVLASSIVGDIADHAATSVGDDIAGCYFALHGAAVSETDDDPEGALLEALRERLGERPLVVSLDLHAQLTSKMVRAVDGVVTYRTSPHVDIAETGERTARVLVEALDRTTAPVVAVAGRPMITPADAHDSTTGPYGSLLELCRTVEQRSGVLAAGLCTTQPWIDVPELGWRAVVTTDGDAELAALRRGGAHRSRLGGAPRAHRRHPPVLDRRVRRRRFEAPFPASSPKRATRRTRGPWATAPR